APDASVRLRSCLELTRQSPPRRSADKSTPDAARAGSQSLPSRWRTIDKQPPSPLGRRTPPECSPWDAPPTATTLPPADDSIGDHEDSPNALPPSPMKTPSLALPERLDALPPMLASKRHLWVTTRAEPGAKTFALRATAGKPRSQR